MHGTVESFTGDFSMSRTFVIGIDPSVNHVGVAYKRSRAHDVEWFQVNPTRGDESGIRRLVAAQEIVRKLKIMCVDDAEYGVIEYPNFQESQRGHIAAQQGYTLDLAFVCGYLVCNMPNTKWLMPTPNKWKGNQPKDAVGKKFTRWTGKDYLTVSDHCFEAAMMIKWFEDL